MPEMCHYCGVYFSSKYWHSIPISVNRNYTCSSKTIPPHASSYIYVLSDRPKHQYAILLLPDFANNIQ